MSVEGEIRRYRKDLKKARTASPDEVAKRLPPFECQQCAKCCRGACGDNTVTVFPGEVRAIMAATGLGWLEVAEPEEDGDVDRYGNRHAFEWALRKKPGGDCVFLEDGRCTIYEARPWICRTYPFYLDEDLVGHGECDGLGKGERPVAMVPELIDRRIRELEESIAMLERLDMDAGRGKAGLIIVHDSEGSRLVSEKDGQMTFYRKSR
jgi:hypothetical protein